MTERKYGFRGKMLGGIALIICSFGLGALWMAQSPADGEHRLFTLPGGVKMEMVYVAPGSFKMGCESGKYNEKPVHDVCITKGYWIGKYPVTQSQWKALVSANGVLLAEYDPPPPDCANSGSGCCSRRDIDVAAGLDTSDFPMYNISWDDCDTLVNALNAKEGGGRTWSIPTEAQWEFAARGGNKSRGYTYSGGNDLDAVGWYYENSGVRRLSDSDWKDWQKALENLVSNKCRPHSVKEKDVGNELGIVGMSGNVFEWCQDRYDHTDYYSKSPVNDPCNTASGEDRVLRGGGWRNTAQFCRSTNRDGFFPDIRKNFFGFRLCCSEGPRK